MIGGIVSETARNFNGLERQYLIYWWLVTHISPIAVRPAFASERMVPIVGRFTDRRTGSGGSNSNPGPQSEWYGIFRLWLSVTGIAFAIIAVAKRLGW